MDYGRGLCSNANRRVESRSVCYSNLSDRDRQTELFFLSSLFRIPIGYWSIPLTSADTATSTSTAPYITGAWPYFQRALGWAKKYNLNVIVDLHGAPGSQNGYDNSGQRTNSPVWGINPSNVTRTVDTLVFLAKEMGDQISVLELLNEAAGYMGNDWATNIRNFWTTAYGAVRNVVGNEMNIMIGDAFLGVNVCVFCGVSLS